MRAIAYAAFVFVTACTVPDKFFQDGGGGGDDIPDADVSGPDAELDTTAPETTITSMPSDFDNDATPSFEFSSDEAGTFVCSFDGEAPAACTSPATRSLGEGPHTFSVTAIDLAGNQDESPASHAWTTDTVVPETTIDSGPPATDNSTTVTFTFSADEANVTFECQLDSGTFNACTSPAMPSGLANGAHTFRVRATDRAGNVDATPDTHPWTIDTATPDTTIDTGPTGPTQGTTATFTFSSNAGGGATYECKRTPPGGAFASCTSPVVFSALTEGTAYTFEVRVRNAALTYDPTPATRTWTVDNTAPNTTFVSGVPATFLAATTVNIGFTCSEATGASYQCSVDGGAFGACSSPYQASGLAQGSHSLAVRCTDVAGNQDATPVSTSWTVDTVAPTTTIMTGPPNSSTSTTANFDFTSNETVTYQCRVDAAAFASCADPYATTVGQGGHTLDVFATDQAGNPDLSPAQDSWTVDSVDPIVTFIAPTPSGTVGPYNTYAWTVNRTATTTCSINGGTAFACTSPYTTHTKAGATSFAVTATDTFGNDATFTRSFTIACSAPVADGVAPAGTVFGLLHMNETSGQSLANVGNGTGNALLGLDNVVETVDPTLLVGARFAGGLTFNKAQNDVVAWNMGSASPYTTHDHTIELWFRPSLDGSAQDLFATSTATGSVRLFIDPAGASYFTHYLITDSVGNMYDVTSPTALTANVWHHIVATYSGTTMTLYQDAEEKTLTTGTIAQNFTFSGIRIGNFAKPYSGDIDEVWLNRTPLTNAQVMPRYCPPS